MVLATASASVSADILSPHALLQLCKTFSLRKPVFCMATSNDIKIKPNLKNRSLTAPEKHEIK